MPRLVLGSASPRRAALLRELGVAFTVRASNVPEMRRAGRVGGGLRAPGGAREGRGRGARPSGGAWVLSADTIVVVDGAVLGKPADAAEARRMLQRLSGREHEVLTAVALTAPDGKRRRRAAGAHRGRLFRTLSRRRDRRLRRQRRAARQGGRLRHPGWRRRLRRAGRADRTATSSGSRSTKSATCSRASACCRAARASDAPSARS